MDTISLQERPCDSNCRVLFLAYAERRWWLPSILAEYVRITTMRLLINSFQYIYVRKLTVYKFRTAKISFPGGMAGLSRIDHFASAFQRLRKGTYVRNTTGRISSRAPPWKPICFAVYAQKVDEFVRNVAFMKSTTSL